MNILKLDGEWKVRDMPLSCTGIAGFRKVNQLRSGWITARVPGEVHLDLVRAGRMEEPLVGLNAKKSRWPEKRSWWYATTFDAPPAILRHERQQLIFDGLDFYAQVFVNGQFLGESKNAFVPYAADVRHGLRSKRNVLVVRLTAGTEQVDKSLRPNGDERTKRQSFRGVSHLRKPQFTYGWDWVDILPNIGIWRGVRLEGHSDIALHDATFCTRLNGNSAVVDGSVVVENLHPWQERHGELVLTIQPPQGKPIHLRKAFAAHVGRSTLTIPIEIHRPRLWWPNGMGDQPLYHVSVKVCCDGKVCDARDMDIGLRTIELDRSAIKSGGSRFCIKVNGQDVFCKGGNWIPADAIIARVDKKKYEALIQDAKNAGLNMLRVWGGGVYESPDFYNACDRAGILVWQDFMFACAEYPDDSVEFRTAVRAEAETVVRTLRHHPSIALWCGNNENIWGFADWWNPGREATEKGVRLGGSLTYNQILPGVCAALDPGRPYWPSSPFGGDRPNSETDGDCHWWPQATMNQDINRRISHEVYDECRARFVSEYGVIGPCHLESVNTFLKRDERYPESRAWKEHTNVYEKATIPAAIARHYADPEDLNLREQIFYGQLFQASMYGRTIEALRFRKHDRRDDCQGALIWMYNDCWGETGWTPIDYYLRRKPSYYWIRNACLPIKAIVRRRGGDLVTRVVNDTLTPHNVRVHYGWTRVTGADSRMRSRSLTLPPNSMLEVAREKIPGSRTQDPCAWVYAAYLTGMGVESSPCVWTLVPHRKLVTVAPKIRVTVAGKVIQLESSVYCHGVHCHDGGKPLFSDNYFDLLPDVPKKIKYLAGAVPRNLRFRVAP